MNDEEFKERNREIWNTWVVGIISSAFGAFIIYYGFSAEGLLFSGRLISIFSGICFQLPLGYFKIYKLILGKD